MLLDLVTNTTFELHEAPPQYVQAVRDLMDKQMPDIQTGQGGSVK